MAVDHILEACSRIECITDTDCTTTSTSSTASEDGSDQPEFLMNSPLVTTIVRRELAIAIRDLMQHGMISVSKRRNLSRTFFNSFVRHWPFQTISLTFWEWMKTTDVFYSHHVRLRKRVEIPMPPPLQNTYIWAFFAKKVTCLFVNGLYCCFFATLRCGLFSKCGRSQCDLTFVLAFFN